MVTPTQPFYGCLCLETFSKHPLPPQDQRQTNEVRFPEIHFNIWEEGIVTKPFLDIGGMLSVNDPAERFEIFLPWSFEATDIEDLSARILNCNGISAVFNEAWTSSSVVNSPGGFVTRSDGEVFTILPYNQPLIKKRQHELGPLHSVVLDIKQLAKTSATTAAQAPKPPEHMYVRFRVKNVPQSFYRVGIEQGDVLGGSSLNRTEIIDVRLNVRRGVPPAIEDFLTGRFIEFSKVQLFLMKSRDQDIVFEDKLFRTCRSLEDENFWAEYILPKSSPQATIAKSLTHVKGSLGYQWKKTPDPGLPGVKEFGILAKFKSFTISKLIGCSFVVLTILVGVVGNTVYDLGKCLLSDPDGTTARSHADATKLPPDTSKLRADQKPTETATKSDGKPTNHNSGKDVRK